MRSLDSIAVSFSIIAAEAAPTGGVNSERLVICLLVLFVFPLLTEVWINLDQLPYMSCVARGEVGCLESWGT